MRSVRFRKIGHDDMGLDFMLLLQLAGQLSELRLGAGREKQIEFFSGEDAGKIEPDTARRSGDKDGFTNLARRSGGISGCGSECGKDHGSNDKTENKNFHNSPNF